MVSIRFTPFAFFIAAIATGTASFAEQRILTCQYDDRQREPLAFTLVLDPSTRTLETINPGFGSDKYNLTSVDREYISGHSFVREKPNGFTHLVIGLDIVTGRLALSKVFGFCADTCDSVRVLAATSENASCS